MPIILSPNLRSSTRAQGPQLAWLGSLIFLVVEFCRYIYLHRLPDRLLIQYVPDDAFYYIALARNFVLLHRWTFDGTAPATGFHLLWGYLLALLFWVFPSISFHQLFAALYFTCAFLLAAGVGFICALVNRLFGRFALLGPMAIFLSYWALNQANLLMESGLVVFFTSLTAYWVAGRHKLVTRPTMVIAVVIGIAGTLARSDYGLLPLLLFLSLFAVPQQRKTAGCILLGAVCGLLIVVGHTHLTSGHWTQGSANEKRYWSRQLGDPIDSAVSFAVKPLHIGGDPKQPPRFKRDCLRVFLLSAFAIAGAAWTQQGRRLPITLTGAMIAVVLAYMFFYHYDSASLQPWYLANFFVPYAILVAAASSIPSRSWQATLVIGVTVWAFFAINTSVRPPWTAQQGFYVGGLYIRQHPALKPVGAWNAGIENYFADGGVVNLDGLVNDDIYSYTVTDSLPQYLQKRGIHSLVDDRAMLSAPVLRNRGGYSGDSLSSCVEHTQRLWRSPMVENPGDQVDLLTLNPQCLLGPKQ